MGIFYREKAFHDGKEIRKNDFAPSEKYACYAPYCTSNWNWACFVPYLKIMNTYLKADCLRTLKNDIKISIDQAVLELLIKTWIYKILF